MIADSRTGQDLTHDTRVGGRSAAALTMGFLLLLALPFVGQITMSRGPALRPEFVRDAQSFGIETMLRQVEHHLVYDSYFARTVRQPYQRFLVNVFGKGSRSVLVGQDRTLFYQTDLPGVAGAGVLSRSFVDISPPTTDVIENGIRRLEGRIKGSRLDPQPTVQSVDSLTSLTSLLRAFRLRDVPVVLVFVPVKATIYPDRLWPAYPLAAGPALNTDYLEWERRLTTAGVDVVDLCQPFWQDRLAGGAPLFLDLDGHWTPRGVGIAADEISSRLRGQVTGPYLSHVIPHSTPFPAPAGLLGLLGLDHDLRLFPDQSISVTTVAADEESAASGDAAPVLLIGDSMSVYYDAQHAGLASQLTLRLHVGVQRLIDVGDREFDQIRIALRTPGVLAHKQSVVIEFVISKLYEKAFTEDWTATAGGRVAGEAR